MKKERELFLNTDDVRANTALLLLLLLLAGRCGKRCSGSGYNGYGFNTGRIHGLFLVLRGFDFHGTIVAKAPCVFNDILCLHRFLSPITISAKLPACHEA